MCETTPQPQAAIRCAERVRGSWRWLEGWPVSRWPACLHYPPVLPSLPPVRSLSQQLKENFPGKKYAKVQDSLKSSCEYSIDRKEQTTPHAPHIESQPRPSASPPKVARKCAYKNTSKVAVADKVFCKTQGAVQVASGLDLLGRNANFQNHPGMAALRLV